MRLVRKLSMALVGGILVIMAGAAWLEVRKEVSIFEADIAADQSAVGRALRVAVETIARDVGVDAARDVAQAAARSQDRVRLRWVPVDDPDLQVGFDEAKRAAIADGEPVPVVLDAPSSESRHATYVPLRLPGGSLAFLELSEPLKPQREFLRRTELQIVLTLVALVALAGLVTVAIGHVMVGKPIEALIEQARRVGVGDLSQRLRLTQRDEIGSLSREIDVMCDRLAEARQHLLEETEARIAALDQLRHADRLKTVGQLASGVAHELGTPLNVVAGRATLIASNAPPASEVVTNARIIREQADRMTTIIRQLLDFARRRGLAVATVDLRDIVRRAAEMLAALARPRGVTLDVTMPTAPLLVRADAAQLQQALVNVMMNGIQAMATGGRLRVAAALVPETGACALTVEDTGAGIASEHLGRVFEPFFTTKTVGEGTGLGLAVSHGIVMEHGGQIRVESVLGKGTRVTVELAVDETVASAMAV